MPTDEKFRISVRDLNGVITTLSEIRPSPDHTARVLDFLELRGQEETAALENSKDRWRAAITVAIDSEGDYLRRFFDYIRDDLLPGPKRKLEASLVNVSTAFIQRLVRTDHPELSDQVDQLASARTLHEMKLYAEPLREIALYARRTLMDPQIGVELIQQLGTIDPERRRLELADLSIDVVTATDYLLHLVSRDDYASQEVFTAGATSSSADRSANDESEKARFGRALDGRGAAVRLGGRLLYALRQDTVLPL